MLHDSHTERRDDIFAVEISLIRGHFDGIVRGIVDGLNSGGEFQSWVIQVFPEKLLGFLDKDVLVSPISSATEPWTVHAHL